jgi:hypothetical protein
MSLARAGARAVGRQQRSWQEQVYGSERVRTLKSRLFVLLRDELGLGRQPKVARLLVDEIVAVVEATLVDANTLQPGQVIVLCPEVGQGPSWTWRKLEDKRLKTVRLTLVAQDDIERLAAGERLAAVRKQRMARLARETYEQGATVTTCQLALMTGISPSRASAQLKEFMGETDEVLPLRGIVEDCSPAVTHKAAIVARHLQGESTAEIARATQHTPRSVERYLARFEQVRELVRYLDRQPDPAMMARILRCSQRLVCAYLELLPAQEQPQVSSSSPAAAERRRAPAPGRHKRGRKRTRSGRGRP